MYILLLALKMVVESGDNDADLFTDWYYNSPWYKFKTQFKLDCYFFSRVLLSQKTNVSYNNLTRESNTG